MDGCAFDEEGRGRRLVPYLQVELVLASRNPIGGSRKLQLTINGEVVLPLTSDGDGLLLFEGKGL